MSLRPDLAGFLQVNMWHFRLNEKIMGEKHFMNPLLIEDEKPVVDENYEENLEKLIELVCEYHATRDFAIFEDAEEIIKNQKFPV